MQFGATEPALYTCPLIGWQDTARATAEEKAAGKKLDL